MKKLIKRLFGGLLNLFKSSENPLLKAPDYSGQKIPPRGNYTKMGPLEPDRVVAPLYYGPYNLPGVNVTALNLKKAQPFPYGQINVEANNGKTLAYPSGNNPLQKAVFRNKAKRQIAGNRGQLFQAGGAFNNLPLNDVQKFQLDLVNTLTGNKPQVKGWEINDGQFNVLTAQGGDKLPKLNEWKFRRTTNNLNNGYSVISDLIMLTVENGYKTYDNPPISSGRTIYVTPNGNDTIFYRNKDVFDHNPQGDKNLKAAKSYFYKMIKLAPTEHSEYKGTKYWSNNDAQIDAARNRAIKGFQGGGEVKSDNTRVASGRPQTVLNKIPWGAGKGPAADSPMRLFNDPYINMGLMAMAPMAVKIQSKNILAPAQSIKYPPVPTNQTYGLLRLYRAAQLKGYKGTIEDFITLSSEILGIPQAMGPEGSKFYGYNLERGNNVLYSRSNPENPKVEGLTVNEPARWQELLKKIIK